MDQCICQMPIELCFAKDNGQGRVRSRQSTEEGMEVGTEGGPLYGPFSTAFTISLDRSHTTEYTKGKRNNFNEKRKKILNRIVDVEIYFHEKYVDC